jgi:5-methylcytosine-specific restriction endonuclease McrA
MRTARQIKDYKRKRAKQRKFNHEVKHRLFRHYESACCFWCGDRLWIEELTVEHLVPRALGGSDQVENIVLACQKCNQEKGRAAERLYKDAAAQWLHQFPPQERSGKKDEWEKQIKPRVLQELKEQWKILHQIP